MTKVKFNSLMIDKRYMCLVVTILSALYCYQFIFKGWIPHDEGLLAQTAERTLKGEIPHVDFDELYTGGLTYLHAVAFKIWGTKLTSLRVMLFLFFLPFIPTIYFISARIVNSWIAALMTMLCVSWSVPNYFASMPSWYNLFFTVFGIALLFRYLDTNKTSYLFCAGLCGGFSFLIKVIGVYYIIAVTIFLIYYEQTSLAAVNRNKSKVSFSFAILKSIFLSTVVIGLFFLIKRHLRFMELIHFVAPGGLICIFMIWLEWKNGHGESSLRVRRIIKYLIPFVLGVAVPISLFFIYYIINGHMGELLHGLFILPQARYSYGSYPLPPGITIITVIPMGILLFLSYMLPYRNNMRFLFYLVSLFFISIFMLTFFIPQIYTFIWCSLRSLVPLLSIVVCLCLFKFKIGTHTDLQKRQEMLFLILITSFISLVQYPYAFGIYFCYFAPVLFLSILYCVNINAFKLKCLYLPGLIFLLLFGLVWLNQGNVRSIGVRYSYVDNKEHLLPDRAGILVSKSSKDVYESLIKFINTNSGNGPYIYAFPDCPEVYFLSEKKNPTKHIYDFYIPRKGNDKLIDFLKQKEVKMVIINTMPEFSRRIGMEQYNSLKKHFPLIQDIGWFKILWHK